jgi:tRNA pseudouridine38-40 synthase
MRRARMTIAYRGDQFNGFATNPGVPSVASVIESALQQVMQESVKVTPAGRTDTGVHAWGQVISLDLPDRIELDVLAKQLNALCGPSIVVREAQWTQPDFHARYSALWRSYRYTVLNTPVPNPFMVETAWHVSRPLRLRAMRLACDAIMGEQDFSAFCRKAVHDDGSEKSMRRFVMKADWVDAGEGILRFDIVANAFCHQMVRSLVGTFVEIGLGKRPPSDMRGLILSQDRTNAAPVAPPQGLCLWEVGYPRDLP